MSKPDVGLTGDTSVDEKWGIWFDTPDHKDCLGGFWPTREIAEGWLVRIAEEEPDTFIPTNIRLEHRVTHTEYSSAVSELDYEEILRDLPA